MCAPGKNRLLKGTGWRIQGTEHFVGDTVCSFAGWVSSVGSRVGGGNQVSLGKVAGTAMLPVGHGATRARETHENWGSEMME